uniref:Uncharacterized protein n=1 Tax=Cucumis melo TaxID=3656 RepID=A0A9I9EBV7_CUCME
MALVLTPRNEKLKSQCKTKTSSKMNNERRKLNPIKEPWTIIHSKTPIHKNANNERTPRKIQKNGENIQNQKREGITQNFSFFLNKDSQMKSLTNTLFKKLKGEANEWR